MVQRSTIRRATAGLVIALTLALAAPAEAAPTLQVRPTEGSAGTVVGIKATGFLPPVPLFCRTVTVNFTDGSGLTWALGATLPSLDGSFRIQRSIPTGVATGAGVITATQYVDRRGPRCFGSPQTISSSASFAVTI
jgi:hypothetical protein